VIKLGIPPGSTLDLDDLAPDQFEEHVTRRLSEIVSHFRDQEAADLVLKQEDPVLYDVYASERPALDGELLYGVTYLYPGKIGSEYFMTKGHFHAILETAEVYYCLQGEGFMVLDTPEGDSSVESFSRGKILYVPPRWAHRVVNTSNDQTLVFFFVYPANAGHDYELIAARGFRKLIVEEDGHPAIIDNPHWLCE